MDVVETLATVDRIEKITIKWSGMWERSPFLGERSSYSHGIRGRYWGDFVL